MKKLKLLPLLFLILLSGQVQAETWEESMTAWIGIWHKLHNSDTAVSDKGVSDMVKRHVDFTPQDPNYTYEQREARLLKYGTEDINRNHSDMTESERRRMLGWIASQLESRIKYAMEHRSSSEQKIISDESLVIYSYPIRLAGERAKQAEAQRRAEIMIPVLEVKAPIADVAWTTDQSTFDYIKTCTTMPFVAIVTHGANHMDLLVEDDEGELIHERDMNIGYPRLADYCAVIAAPKSGLSTTYNEYDEAEHWRTWWMTEGVEDENGIPVRDENDEVAATIALVKLAKTAVGKPIYLVIGNDLGASAAMVLDKMTNDGEANLVDGFIRVHRDTGEFTTYHRDGTIWESKDNPVSE
jgi:hypothetical protein